MTGSTVGSAFAGADGLARWHPTHPSSASSTTSALTCPASALDTWYGLPTYVMFVFGTVCGLW